MDNDKSKEFLQSNQFNALGKDNQESKKTIPVESNAFQLDNYEYVTKGRKTLYNSSSIHLESPKKDNPSRSKRMSLLRKQDKDIKINKTNTELFSFSKNYNNSIRKDNEHKEDEDKINYKRLIKKIAEQLKKRIKFPSCTIIKIYQPYRELIFRIAKGIKKTSKEINLKKLNNKKEWDKFGISLISKEKINNSKRNVLNSRTKKEMEENINLLLNIDDIKQDNKFMNSFENFLQKNNIEIIIDSKLPSFNEQNNKYLLSEIIFWIKYIKYISNKYKEDLTLYNFIDIIELFYIWIDDNKCDCNIFNKLIKEQLELLFDKSAINEFLSTFKLNNLEDIFSRYKNMNNINLKEIKISDDCQCPNCKNIKENLINYNKKNLYISYSEENNLNFGIIKEIKKFPEIKTLYDNKFKDISLSINSKNNYKKITDYFRYSTGKRPFKNFPQNTIIQYNDKKTLDSFLYKKEKVFEEPKKREEKRLKSIDKNKKRRSSSINKKKKMTKSGILELLNLEI